MISRQSETDSLGKIEGNQNELEMYLPSHETTIEQKQCPFCSAPFGQGESITLFKKLYGLYQLIEINSLPEPFFVLHDLVPIGETSAHLLFLPKKLGKGHYISLAGFEPQSLVAETASILAASINAHFPNNPIFVFEHGAGFVEGMPVACGGCHVDHAHGHIIVLPKGINPENIIAKAELSLKDAGWDICHTKKIQNHALFTDLYNIAKFNPYIHFGYMWNGKILANTYVQTSIQQHIESQFFRRIIAQEVYNNVHSNYWHWRDAISGFGSEERLQELRHSISVFRQIFSLNSGNVFGKVRIS